MRVVSLAPQGAVTPRNSVVLLPQSPRDGPPCPEGLRLSLEAWIPRSNLCTEKTGAFLSGAQGTPALVPTLGGGGTETLGLHPHCSLWALDEWLVEPNGQRMHSLEKHLDQRGMVLRLCDIY